MHEIYIPDQEAMENIFRRAVNDGDTFPVFSEAERRLSHSIFGIPGQGVNFLETSVTNADGTSSIVDVPGYDPNKSGVNSAQDPRDPDRVIIWTGGEQPSQRNKEDYPVNVTPPKK